MVVIVTTQSSRFRTLFLRPGIGSASHIIDSQHVRSITSPSTEAHSPTLGQIMGFLDTRMAFSKRGHLIPTTRLRHSVLNKDVCGIDYTDVYSSRGFKP